MLKKDITYEDLDGNEITETFWFHLSKAELAEMALGKEGKAGGFETWVKTLINSNDGEVMTQTFKKILLSTIGERSEDNKRFIKNDQIRDNFVQSDAYSVLFMELMTDADKMSAFINGVVPSNMRDEVAKSIQNAPDLETFRGPSARVEEKRVSDVPSPVEKKDEIPDWVKDGRVPTEAELRGASSELLMEAFRRKSANISSSIQQQIPPQ